MLDGQNPRLAYFGGISNAYLHACTRCARFARDAGSEEERRVGAQKRDVGKNEGVCTQGVSDGWAILRSGAQSRKMSTVS